MPKIVGGGRPYPPKICAESDPPPFLVIIIIITIINLLERHSTGAQQRLPNTT